ncbi:uncharacterized protein NFIA_043730 [Aspergillus fischeri NRRL 181]|uniref:Uncharacterized protein n=1 Tax=Neosartorya fischeri (strain ATCC 1020 / DSM 3700 / CBS 544.65 / FGSC A1164 / JCM 1740 / NRRL 181 / WB 181) TaxID=331117 RepID=A1CUX7_NEOFI|nr:conserved hypothetical protein [Aspergillus fischeri NRRL 181]EAW25554.1 conserved hypothetical protein [Aspergillus fischeri NRRL 181]KAG2001364.1 hypothetical protein GB937_010203 [Aspergillus fischeri]
MQCARSGSSTPLGRDPDARWVQWLALTRRNNHAPLSGAMSPSSSTSLPMACSNLNYSSRVRSRSSATSYFALLSAAEDGHQHQREDGPKQHYNGSGTPTRRHMDSSWVAWLNERGHQRRQGGLVGDSTQSANSTGKYSSDQSRSPSETPVQLQPQTCLPDSTVVPSSFLNTSAFTTNTVPSMISSAATEFPSPLEPLPDAEIDVLSQQFPDFADRFPAGFPDATVAMGPFDPAELDAGLLTWLDEQHAFAFNLGEDGPVSPSKRGLTLEAYPREMSAEGMRREGGIKKQKLYHEAYTEPGKSA